MKFIAFILILFSVQNIWTESHVTNFVKKMKEPEKDIEESDFSNLYILEIAKKGSVRLIKNQYNTLENGKLSINHIFTKE